MTETADPLVLDFVEWVAREPRLYAEVVGTWKTSCPRLTIWEDAADKGYVARETVAARAWSSPSPRMAPNCCAPTAASPDRCGPCAARSLSRVPPLT